MKALGGEHKQQQPVPKRSVIGIGAGAHYTLYDAGSDRVEFHTAGTKAVANARLWLESHTS